MSGGGVGRLCVGGPLHGKVQWVTPGVDSMRALGGERYYRMQVRLGATLGMEVYVFQPGDKVAGRAAGSEVAEALALSTWGAHPSVGAEFGMIYFPEVGNGPR